MSLIYKIVDAKLWQKAIELGRFDGAAIDLEDGYIHLSDESQAEETARRYFAGKDHLLLVAFDPSVFGETLKWEPSRGGALFPHVYDTIDPATALWAKPLPWKNMSHAFPAGWKA